MADEEDIGRERVVSLDERQRARTLISAAAPSDIVTGNAARVEPLSPIGIRVSELRPEQAAILVRLLEVTPDPKVVADKTSVPAILMLLPLLTFTLPTTSSV